MSNPKKTHEPIRQNGVIVKKPQKHDANLQKSTTIYFQVGLIVCLLTVYGLLEMKVETTIPKEIVMKIPDDNITDVSIDKYKVYEPKSDIKQKVIGKKVILTTNPKIVDNDWKIKDALDIESSDQNITSDKPIDPKDVNVPKKDEEVNISVNFVEVVPIYPGCEEAKNNDERRKCMSEKISKLVQKNFDGSIAPEYGLSGIQRINVVFKIDKTGHVTNIRARSTHPKLDEEAERVINRIPDMVPGKQLDKPVGVIYSLPIIFKVQD